MTIEYIRYKVQPEQRAAFVQSYAKAAEQLNASEYCLAYELAECEEEAGQFLLRIEWTSTEEHLQGFRKSGEFSQFLSHVKAYFDSIQEMRHYKLTEISKRK
jgi:quinol monooxygenase YgiN